MGASAPTGRQMARNALAYRGAQRRWCQVWGRLAAEHAKNQCPGVGQPDEGAKQFGACEVDRQVGEGPTLLYRPNNRHRHHIEVRVHEPGAGNDRQNLGKGEPSCGDIQRGEVPESHVGQERAGHQRQVAQGETGREQPAQFYAKRGRAQPPVGQEMTKPRAYGVPGAMTLILLSSPAGDNPV